MTNNIDWEEKIKRQLFVHNKVDDPAVAVDLNFLRQCVAENDIRDREWFYSIFDQVPRSLIREALLAKKIPVVKIILDCIELMAEQQREYNFRQEVHTTNRIRPDHGQRRRGGPTL